MDHQTIPQHTLKPQDIDPLIEEIGLSEQGAMFYYAIDPFEIVDFCLPINPESFSTKEIDTVADNQATLYDVFYVNENKPVLLHDYSKEFEGIEDHLKYRVDSFYGQAETIERFIQEGHLKTRSGSHSKGLERIEENFNVLLAVAMGIYKLGAERFRDVKERHLAFGQPETQDKTVQSTMGQIFDEYVDVAKEVETGRGGQIDLRKVICSHLRGSGEKAENDVSDASAVHRLIYLNSALEQAFLDNKLERRQVILYLSSARKTATIFSMPEVQRALPTVAGKPYKFWRTRDQLFAYIVHRSKTEDPAQQARESTENLRHVQGVLTEIQERERVGPWATTKCDSCILDDRAAWDCKWKSVCEGIRDLSEKIQSFRPHIQNLGLFTNVIETVTAYQRLIQTKPPPQQAVYVQLFKEACDSGIKDVALDRMSEKLRWVQGKSQTINAVKDTLQSQDHRRALRTIKDRITGIHQILPTKPKLNTNKYIKILDAIISYYKDPSDTGALEQLRGALESYLKLDLSLEKRDPEYGLVKCYLFLAFPSEMKDERNAYADSKALLKTAKSLKDGAWLEQESRYVLCWAARRLGEFQEADECAKTALEGSVLEGAAYDARFYHGLSLNAYSWLTDKSAVSKSTYEVVDVIQFARAAVENYKRDDEVGNRDVIATSYNNLAYFLAWDVTTTPYALDVGRKRLDRAREYLTKLKTMSPKEEWSPDHPEYFHTEAYLEYEEYKLDWLNKKNKAYLEDKLKHALREIEHAVELYPEGPEYLTLKKSIEKGLDDISSGRLVV